MPKILTIVAILASILIVVGLSKQITDALDSGKRLDKIADDVSKLQEKNRELENKLNGVQQYDFMEDIARNKLNLAKPNETIVIIPDSELQKILDVEKPVIEPKIPNWQGWLKLFVH